MPDVHGGILAGRALKAAGVECIFTLCGGHIMPLYAGCQEQGIRIIDVRHEQAAVHAADAWARCNPGKIGVAAITAGPGVTDGVTGHRERVARQLADPRVRRSGAVREPAPRLAPGDGPHRRRASDHQVRRRDLPDPPHSRVHRARDPPRGLGDPGARLSRDPDGRVHGHGRGGQDLHPAHPHRGAAALAGPRGRCARRSRSCAARSGRC